VLPAAQQVFDDHRGLLFSIVYNMLGSVADAEDVLQETWLSWTAADQEHIDHPRAYLVRIAVNRDLARQAALCRRRETSIGSGLPEPLVTTTDAADQAVREDTLSLALLVVLETLTPLERAVFILHEAFAYPHADIATMIDRSPAAVRQLAHRARGHVQVRRPRTGLRTLPITTAIRSRLSRLPSVMAPTLEVRLWANSNRSTASRSPRANCFCGTSRTPCS
jgi:RNA polymerase sigma factor (sigma-70 family)